MKPENIQLHSDGSLDSIKIVNFEISTKLEKGLCLTEKIGSPYYIAPEVLEKNYDSKCDVWSCGVIAYICLYGYAPFAGSSDLEILEKVKKGRFSLIQSIRERNTISDEARDFLVYLITRSPSKRPSAEQALMHPWLNLAQK